MTLGGIAPYFGSKREMAPQIVSHFGQHHFYAELFAGSLAVLLRKPPCRQEVVSEKNPWVVNLIRCLSDETIARNLWAKMESRLVSESEFGRMVEYMADHDAGVEDYVNRGECCTAYAEAFLLVSWQGPSGLAGTTRKPRLAVRNTTSGGSVVARWRAVSESIPEWHERLRNVEFRDTDALALAGRLPDEDGATVYCDPPYLSDTRSAGRYACDFIEADHEHLAVKLRRFQKTRVVLSYYDSPKLDALYPGWRKVVLSAPRKMKHVAGGEQQTVDAPEILLINRD